MEEFDELKENQLDKIEIHNTAKGFLQASVKLHDKCIDQVSIKRLIERQKYAWDKLRETFPNLIWSENSKDEIKNTKEEY